MPFASTIAYISSSITTNFPASFTICPCKSPFRVAGQLALADKVVNAVKSGAIRKFVVMAGCDGRMKKRNYYTEFAEQLPDDCVILTAGFAKYRYNKLSLGDINGIPPRTGYRTMQRQLFTSIDRHETTGCIRVGRNVAKVLVENFGIDTIQTPEKDIEQFIIA